MTADNAVPLEMARRAAEHGVDLIRASTIKPEPIKWIWPGWLAQGKLHILAGAPGAGKTTIGLKLAAAVTTAGSMPDGWRAPKGDVLIWSGEDAINDTLNPRLLACGADLDRVHFVGDVKDRGRPRPFDPAVDMPRLAAAAKALPALRLVIVDSIVSAIAGDSHKNTEVRRGLQPLVDLGHEAGAAVLGISHFSKGTGGRDPVERVSGSIAFGALARIVLCAAKPADDEDGPRKLVRAKSNIGPDTGGFSYSLTLETLGPELVGQAVTWGESLDGTARQILGDAEAMDDEGGAKAEAADFLRDLLAFGPVPAKKVQAAARGTGLAWRTVRRAKDDLGVVSEKSGTGGWSWRLSQGVQEGQGVQGGHANQVGALDWEVGL
ncbi:MAG: AAA family ATPase [Phycisphaerales bacterium JB052]